MAKSRKTPKRPSRAGSASASNDRSAEAKRTAIGPHALAFEAFAGALAAHKAGDLEAAIRGYHDALHAVPDFADALANLGVALRRAGRNSDAIRIMTAGLERCGEAPELRYNLGNALRDAERQEEAASQYQAVLRLDPDHRGAAINLGLALRTLGRMEGALEHYRVALARHPGEHELFNNLGSVLWERRRFEAAIACFRRALAIRPDFAPGRANLALGRNVLGQYDAAETLHRAMVEQTPGDAAAWAGLGQTLINLGRLDEALEVLDKALGLDGEEVDALLGRARALLLAGRLAEGFAAYGARRRKPGDWRPRTDRPAWRGEPLDGERILVYGEQGFGDVLQFVRYLPMVAARGGTVVLLCQRPIAALCATVAGVSEVASNRSKPPAHDLHCSVMDLPMHFGTTMETIPAQLPYLALPEKARRHVADARRPGFHLGIAWRGNPEHWNDRNRSCPLRQFAPLLAVPGVVAHSLQKGPAAVEIGAEGLSPLVGDLGARLGDFSDTAAALHNLDLVVTVDTALAHLAGAFGRPVWVLLPYAPDWRWMLGRADSPWYPTMRLFRQPSPGDWESVFAEVETALAEKVAGTADSGKP